MTFQIALVLLILGLSVLLLISEWVPMEATALLVLGTLALTGLVTPADALSGFSNPAVVTVWAVFILSGALTRTGIGNIIGHRVLKIAGHRETGLIIIIMLTAGLLSAFMNNVAVAALMLPVIMDICRSTDRPPSKLLLPLAYGSLLGGLTTQIGTPPNILVSEVLRDNQLTPFRLFDFTPVGGFIFVIGTLFMALIGRHLLPKQDFIQKTSGLAETGLDSQYQMQEHVFSMKVPEHSKLSGKSLSELRMGTILGMDIIAIKRRQGNVLAPGPQEKLTGGDRLVVKGNPERLAEVRNWKQLIVKNERIDPEEVFSKEIELAEVRLTAKSGLPGRTLSEIDFRNRLNVMVLAIRREGSVRRANIQDEMMKDGDWLLLQGSSEKLKTISTAQGFEEYRGIDKDTVTGVYRLHERLMLLSVPGGSALEGKTLKESRLAEVMGVRVLCIMRGDGTVSMPDPIETLHAEDRLVVEGRIRDIELLRAFKELEVDHQKHPDLKELVSDKVGIVETILSPHSTLAGKTLRHLNFREKFGLNVLAVLRRGVVYSSHLRDMALDFGDALLLYGQRERLNMLGREPDFIVLTETAQETPRTEKARIAFLIMVATFVPVILGWVPIYIATVIGGAFMVIFRCLTMEEAYRYIEWKAVFLIAGMFPLGMALDQSGAAKYLAEGVVASVGPLGPTAVMLALLLLTFLATCFIPTAALVLLLAPIILNTSSQLGISPHSLMMAMAMAASASFMTPISHPANILVMGPGGYRFKDYIKVGGLLTLVVLGIIMLVVPIFWPLKI